MTPTTEQKNILSSVKNMRAGEILIVNALAGCAKTTTLQMITEDNPDSKFLYLAFNRKIIDEGKSKFPKNTKLSTLHALARGYSGRKELKSMNLDLIADILNLKIQESKENFFKAFNAYKVYEKFCHSFYYLDKLPKLRKEIESELKEDFKDSDNSEWLIKQRLSSLNYVEEIHEYIKHSDFTTFDTFMKDFVETSKNRRFNYEYILLDESQDISKLLAKFIISLTQSRRYKIITVGDKNQKIYSFLGNIDITQLLIEQYSQSTITKELTQTFRFNKYSEIEYLSNLILNLREYRIEGTSKEIPEAKQDAYLARSTFPLLAMAIYQIEHNQDYYLFGGTENFNKHEIQDIFNLYLYSVLLKEYDEVLELAQKETDVTLRRPIFPKIKTKSIQPFHSFEELFSFVKERHIGEIDNSINIALYIFEQAEKLQIPLTNSVNIFFEMIDKNSNPESKTVISTIHKSKGLEFQKVTILKSLSLVYNPQKDKWVSYQADIGKILGLEKVDLTTTDFSKNNDDITDIFESFLAKANKKSSHIKTYNSKYQEKTIYEYKITLKPNKIREEYNILYVGITRAKEKIVISNVHYSETLDFLKFIDKNSQEIAKILNNQNSHLLEEFSYKSEGTIFTKKGIIYDNAYFTVETLKEYLLIIRDTPQI